MLITLISGSPRKGENSERIIDRSLPFFTEKGYETERVALSTAAVGPCTHCNYCKNNPRCNIDEEANRINGTLSRSDAVLVVSPVYFGSMTGQLKCLLDKTLPLRRDNMKLKGTIGAALAVGGSRNGGQELAIKDIHAWMLVHGMVVVGDNNHFGGTIHAPFESDESGVATLYGTLTAMDELLKRLK